MAFKAAKCPNCAGELQVPDERNTVKCMYCGSDIIVREAIKAAVAGVNIENLFNLAKSAFDAGNFQEAFDYYTRVLEVDAQNYDAWLGKGLSAGWMSTLAEFRFPEMINGVDKALEYSPDNLKEQMKVKAAYGIHDIITACRNVVADHKIEHGYLEKVKIDIIFKRRNLIEALEYAYNLIPNHDYRGFIITDIVFLCTDIIEGSAEVGGSEASYRDIKEKQDSYILKQKILNPLISYDVPIIKNSSSTDSKCFVATTTMGNVNHPTVVLLREFRDAWLLERKYGQIFIKSYYKVGPYLAMILNKCPYLKHISYMMIIRPAAYIADLLLKHKHTKGMS